MFRYFALFLVFPVFLAGPALAQSASPMPGVDHSQHMGQQMDHSQHMGGGAFLPGERAPVEAGQDAFGTVQEIIALLNADPATDWSRVNIGALREHLVDMDDVMMKSQAEERAVEGGLDIQVTGEGRVRDAARRMVLAHAPMLEGEMGWSARAEQTPTGARLVVTATAPEDQVKIRALGFYGLMASGAHHAPHHLGMALGEMVHAH